MTRLLLRLMSAGRLKERGIYFFNMPALSTVMDCTVISSRFSPFPFAEAAALLMSFAMGSAARFGRNWRVASAAGIDLPFTSSVTRRTLRGGWLWLLRVALALRSFSEVVVVI